MSEFYRNRSRPDGRQAHCRRCRVRIDKRSRARHPDTRRNYRNKFHLRNCLLVLEYLLLHPCVDCGEADPLVLDFDHCGKKRYNIATMLFWESSWKTIEQEISRCKVRCANCHRRKTAREEGWLKAELLQKLLA